MDVVKTLQEVEAFRGLKKKALQRLAKVIEQRTYERGEKVIKRGEPGDCMLVITKGCVRVPIVDENGRQQMLAELGEGQCVGEIALLTGEPRNADVVAGSEPCECLAIPREALNHLLESEPQVAVFLTELLGERLMSFNGIRQVGKYKLIGTLGKGGVATVYEGVHPDLGRSVAIKMLSHRRVYHPHFADRFRNEARIIANLRHPNIVEVFDTEEAYATFFIIMEKLKGRDIEAILDEGRIFGFDEVRRILYQTATALDYAHNQGVVHRDVKPSNIFLSEDGRVKLTDFGIALVHHLEESIYVDKRRAIGSPLYMSPEQAMAEPLDHRTDIYALGIVAYEMLTGLPPFEHEDAREVLMMHVNDPMPAPRTKNPSIPGDLNDFILRATQKDPNKRYQSAAEVLEFLAQATDFATNLSVKTLTFVYRFEQAAAVEALVQDAQKKGTRLKGVMVR